MQGIQTQHRGVVALQPADLVDGDREKTLALLWRLILRFQLPALVDPGAIRIEIDRLTGRPAGGAAAAGGGGGGGRGAVGGGAGGGAAAAPCDPPGIVRMQEAGAAAEHLAALLEWAQVVVARYGLPLRDYSCPAFADGSAFCLLVREKPGGWGLGGEGWLKLGQVGRGGWPEAV